MQNRWKRGKSLKKRKKKHWGEETKAKRKEGRKECNGKGGGRERGMDRWKSGTPETCHSSHHHAVCTLFLFPCRSSSLPPPPPTLPNLTFFEGISFLSIHLYLLSRSRRCWETSRSFPLVCRQLQNDLSFFSCPLDFAVNPDAFVFGTRL